MLIAAPALAQDQGGGAPAPAPGPSEPPGPSPTPNPQPGGYVPYGLPPPGTDLESHLPSGSHATSDTSHSTDTFDYNKPGGGPSSISGGKNGQYVEGGGVPESHSVRRGDTLWGISAQYFRSPYEWPKLWAENPQILNPHWIYPGDRIRLREPEEMRIGGPTRSVAPDTVFIRDYGWVDDPDKDTWGELVGSPRDNMIVDNENEVYLQLDDDVKVELGDELTVFRVIHTFKGEEADAPGELVSVRGMVKIDKINKKTHIARAKIIETIDTIERGAFVGPVRRKFDVVPPQTNEKYVEARILTALYPNAFFGQNQIVFLDRGEKDGVKPGNRFLAVKRGDDWVDNLGTAGSMASKRALIEDDRNANYDQIKTDGPEDDYPDEQYAEFRVITVRDHTCMALITESRFEVEREAVLIMKKGY
jgi:LysM domain